MGLYFLSCSSKINKHTKYQDIDTIGFNIDSVKFTNGGPGTGFETDNYTVLLDGTVRQFDVPEPATFGLAGLSLALLAYGIRKRAIA